MISEKKVKLPNLNFPTSWQTVIFRNYGFVKTKQIGKVLGCDEKTVIQEASRLGLEKIPYNPDWEEKGYITIIRNNWFLLSTEQLCILLNFSNEKWEYTLKEEDFLYIKLGEFKPVCPQVKYAPLTLEQIKQTNEIVEDIKFFGNDEGTPFDFFKNIQKQNKNIKIEHPVSGTRIIHGYLSPCGDILMLDSRSYLDDDLIFQYAKLGINAIFLHSVLSTLSYYPFCESLSEGYEQRRKMLNGLVKRCKKYGIKVFLYLNEPRCLDIEKFGKYSHLMGYTKNGAAALCMLEEETQQYLYNAVLDLLKNVPELGGFLSITMSENLTHCYSHGINYACEKCKKKQPYEFPAMVNNIIMKAIKDSGTEAELIALLWGWADYMGWSQEMVDKAIALLDKDISVLCVSEFDLQIEKGGIKSKICEYSISNIGPSEITKHNLSVAKKYGHKLYAKTQINNSWECPSVPCIPVFDLMYKHLQNLREIGIENNMLSWTLGGYPSLCLDLVNSFYNGMSLSEWYKDKFGDNASAVQKAIMEISNAFTKFPYSMSVVYFSPKTMGYGNMWELEDEEKTSSMVCYSFDDFEKWIEPYDVKTYLHCLEELLDGWKNGLSKLQKINGDNEVAKLQLYANVVYLLFKADYNQTLFSLYKRDLPNKKTEIKEILSKSLNDVSELIELQRQDATIGYESSNHYLYNTRLLKEKRVNLKRLLKEIDSI